MPREFNRKDRVGELIQRELAEIFQREIELPQKGGLVTVAAVDVSPDLRQAKIYITVLGKGEEESQVIVAALNDMAGEVRYHLADRLAIRGTPKLHFVYDTSIETGSRISSLLNEVNPDKNSDSE